MVEEMWKRTQSVGECAAVEIDRALDLFEQDVVGTHSDTTR